MRDTSQLAKIFGDHTVSQLSSARVLVVGAGGIGCELLKNLAMSGFHSIHSIDLDHIDLSNLNRQFLFQRRHIKLSKSQVATAAITRFNPRVRASAEQANITNTQYDVDWFAQFDIVLNALDNLEARRHVNTMCLAARVPLVESGTAGYLGQVTVIKGAKTECFECQPKPVERKTYPVCTIRSTPTTPIHCIVWAKDYLFAQLFAESSDEGAMDVEETAENSDELSALREESTALAKLAGAMGTQDFARLVFDKVFDEDVERLLSMKDMWVQRRPPTVLDFAALSEHTGFDPAHPDDHAVLEPKEWCALFVHSAERLAQRRLAMDQSTQSGLVFDKDDDDTLHFVAATANLRSLAFGIEQKSIFATKAMAGNIIPAIATTNAIVAGMMVMQAILVLAQRIPECHTSYVTYGKRARCIIKEPLAEPNPRCPVCRRRYLTLRVRDCAQTTLGDVLDFVKGLDSDRDLQLGDDISVVEGTRMLYDPDFDDNLSKPLYELGIVSGKMITLTSEDDDDGSIVPVVLSIAAAKSQDSLAIEGFESVPIFAPLPQLVSADAESDDEDDVITDDFVVDDSGAIVLEDDDVVTSPMIASAVSSISEELSKRKLDEISVISQDDTKRRAVSDDDIEVLD
ncbi:E1 ubiquitin-activating protein uba2 [Coemansia erecta]|nr:E1 ubiquitin-activating protein uba2 [Coemansia erecta]